MFFPGLQWIVRVVVVAVDVVEMGVVAGFGEMTLVVAHSVAVALVLVVVARFVVELVVVAVVVIVAEGVAVDLVVAGLPPSILVVTARAVKVVDVVVAGWS